MAVWSWLCLWSPIPSFLLQSRLIFFLSILLCPSLTRTYTFEYTHRASPFLLFPFSFFCFLGVFIYSLFTNKTARTAFLDSSLITNIINLTASLSSTTIIGRVSWIDRKGVGGVSFLGLHRVRLSLNGSHFVSVALWFRTTLNKFNGIAEHWSQSVKDKYQHATE